MPEERDALLDLTPAEYAALSETQAQLITKLADNRHQREARHALTGMLCGTGTLACCFAAYVYLVMQSHSTEAYVVLGSAVLAVITKILRSRL